MERAGSSQPLQDAVAPTINLEDLFHSSRVQMKPKFYKAILYLPVAVLLLFVRLVIGFFGFLVLSFLPRTSQKRSVILKGICKVFGLVVEVDDKYTDDSAKLLIANHVSLLDRLAVNIMVPCYTIAKDFKLRSCFSFWDDVDIRYSRNLSDDEILALHRCIDGTSMRVLHFPEGATTSGKMGLLKFHPGIFSSNAAIQPVLIHVSLSSSFMTISPSVLGSSAWVDVLWCFILPFTFFKLKILPSMSKLPGETAVDFCNRVQQTMAQAMDLIPTVYTCSDKAELVKRLQTSASVSTASSRSVLKRSVISVSEGQSSDSQKLIHLSSIPPQKLTMNTAADTFGKSPRERMASYQERKEMLLLAARLKYLEKHKE